jgi:hypothetical protein
MAFLWNTSGTTLQYNSNYYQLRGFSLTSTEYHSAEFNNTGWYDFGWNLYTSTTNPTYQTVYANQTVSPPNNTVVGNGNSGLTLNCYYLMENIFLQFKPSGNGTVESPYTAPCIRIPLCADLWLNGSSQQTTINSTSSPYYVQGQSNVNFTGPQYQQAIIDIIYYCYTIWNNNDTTSTPISFILDLHWNYAAPCPLTSASYQTSTNITNSGPNPNSSPPNPNPNYSISNASSEQLPLCGVCTSDGLSLSDNTINFWTSVSNLLGIDNSGNPINTTTSAYVYTNSVDSSGNVSLFTKSTTTQTLPTDLLQNIFFELYNEPFTDYITSTTTTYSSSYDIYIDGSNNALWNGNTYNFTGMATIYNTIRGLDCQNILVIAGSDSYAFMNFNTSLNNGQWNSSTNSISNTYNCFTKLRDSIGSNNFYNVILNLHPYVGLYSGALKHPGYYDPSYNVQIAGFGQIVSGLHNPSLTNFYMNCPIICTEYGQYDLPFSTYSTNNIQPLNPVLFQYPNTYIQANGTNPSLYYFLGSSSYGSPMYNGNYVDISGNVIYVPGIIGYLNDFISLNVSFCAWAIRPNSGGCGQLYSGSSGTFYSQNFLMGTDNIYYYGFNPDVNAWAAFQPDIATGCWCAYPQQPSSAIYPTLFSTTPTSTSSPSIPINNPGTPTTINNAYSLQLIGGNNQNLSTSTFNFGCQGADFQFIFDNYYNTTPNLTNVKKVGKKDKKNREKSRS